MVSTEMSSPKPTLTFNTVSETRDCPFFAGVAQSLPLWRVKRYRVHFSATAKNYLAKMTILVRQCKHTADKDDLDRNGVKVCNNIKTTTNNGFG